MCGSGQPYIPDTTIILLSRAPLPGLPCVRARLMDGANAAVYVHNNFTTPRNHDHNYWTMPAQLCVRAQQSQNTSATQHSHNSDGTAPTALPMYVLIDCTTSAQLCMCTTIAQHQRNYYLTQRLHNTNATVCMCTTIAQHQRNYNLTQRLHNTNATVCMCTTIAQRQRNCVCVQRPHNANFNHT
jgi:hypothetical protein